MSRGLQKKLAAVSDMTGFGRCALTVTVPVVSAMGVQCCPLPTAFFSNHTAYPSFYKADCTQHMPYFLDEWRKLGLRFDGILTGYLGSEEQIDIARHLTEDFTEEDAVVLVDPVMGDNGIRYSSYTEKLAQRMGELAALADIVTPNLTECCILTGREYEKSSEEPAIVDMAEELLDRMCQQSRNGRRKSRSREKYVVVSGIPREGGIGNLCLPLGGEPAWVVTPKAGKERCGTGDVFSAILAAGAVRGMAFEQSVRQAAEFIGACIRRSEELEIPQEDGICFEEFLGKLCR